MMQTLCVIMKTSEIIECLRGREPWSTFEKRHQAALARIKHRKDGALVSSDIGLEFDKTLLLENEHLKTLANLGDEDRWTISNLIVLCGFEFNSSETEECFFTMCEHENDA